MHPRTWCTLSALRLHHRPGQIGTCGRQHIPFPTVLHVWTLDVCQEHSLWLDLRRIIGTLPLILTPWLGLETPLILMAQLGRSPLWNPWHRDNGRMSHGLTVYPPFSNDWAFPDGHPVISQGPHGMGMDVTFGTSNAQGLVWAVVQDAADSNLTIGALKAADKAWGPPGCRQMGVPAIYPATYTLTLSSCSLLPTPKLQLEFHLNFI